MNDDQITALAREYAEEMRKDILPFFPRPLPESMEVLVKADQEKVERVIRFLLRRFCLVEKRKAIELCCLTLEHGDSVDYGLIDGLTDIVCEIFPEQHQQVAEELSNPEIAKEVEG